MFLQQDAAELRERLRGQVVQSLEQVLPLQDVKREHAHLAAVGGLDAVGELGVDEAGARLGPGQSGAGIGSLPASPPAGDQPAFSQVPNGAAT